MNKLILYVLATVSIFTQGCCSIFKSGPQLISVDSKPQGADVEIGPHRGKTPYTVSLPKGKDYAITVSFPGHTETVSIGKSMEPFFFANVLFWPGIFVDSATGAMYKYEPTHYEFDLEKLLWKRRLAEAEARRRKAGPRLTWKVVLPKPYKYIDIGRNRFGINIIFVHSKEEAEKYRQQGADVEPWYQDTYHGMRIP
jgi:hypothetical protein